jgi:hypothetical protein
MLKFTVKLLECYLWWRRLLLWRFPCNFIDAMLCALFRDPVSSIASRCSGYFLILITHNHMLVVPKDAQTNHARPSVYNCPGSCRFPGLNHLICHHTLRNQWPTRQQTAINAPCQMRLQPKADEAPNFLFCTVLLQVPSLFLCLPFSF